jgi:hypothetical protein
MTDNRTTELESLSKLKMAGRLRYWRGTIEIPEIELHAICDEIQAEYDNAVHALNKAAGNWAKADAELREKGDMAMARATDELRKSLDFMRIWISEDAHLGESAISRELEKAEGLRKLDAIEQAIAATLGSEPPYDELLCCLENDWHIKASWDGLRKFWCIELTEEGVKLRDATHGTLTAEQVEKATYAHSIHADCADADWQAIADELNELGSGTCENVAPSYLDFLCSSCGFVHYHSDANDSGDGNKWSYCPNCGKVVSA